ncbi:MAG: hypothetical protein AB7P21_26200 [Lautropia sp.]
MNPTTDRPGRGAAHAGFAFALLGVSIVLGGCGTAGPASRAVTPAPAAGAAMPARLESGMGAACFAQIEAVVERETGNRVMIGPAAFSTSDELVLVRTPRQGADGRVLDGRSSIPKPAVFHLSWQANRCLLSTAGRESAPPVELPACRCEPR